MSVLKKLASETATYGISTMLGRFLNYLLVALHTKLFEPEQIAAQGQLYAYAGLARYSTHSGWKPHFSGLHARKKTGKQYYNLILSAVILVSLFFSGLMFIFAESLSAELIKYPESVSIVRMFAVIMATDGIVSIPLRGCGWKAEGQKICDCPGYQHSDQHLSKSLLPDRLQGHLRRRLSGFSETCN
jgi:O-antigen/teichoic acid export membrane protein